MRSRQICRFVDGRYSAARDERIDPIAGIDRRPNERLAVTVTV